MRKKRPPTYRLHAPTGQAVVTIHGRDKYLGKHGTPASREAYARVLAEWAAGGTPAPANRPSQPDRAPESITIVELVVKYIQHARVYYRRQDGTPTGEAENIRQAIRHIRTLYGRTPAVEFGPLQLRAVRETLIQAGRARRSINADVSRIKQMFRWAAEHGHVPPSTYEGVRLVAGLRAGRSEARETPPVRPVSVEAVEQTIPHLSPTVAAMVRLQLTTGMRPGEVCDMRTCDIDTTGELWTYRPPQHKTAHHQHDRFVMLGPKAQKLVRPFLRMDKPDAWLFSPADSAQARRDARTADRKTPAGHGNGIGTNRKSRPKRRPGERFDVHAYRRAIARACEAAFGIREAVGPRPAREDAAAYTAWLKRCRDWRNANVWHPHALRHTAATLLRKTFGIEAAQVVLGHKTLSVTELYAEQNIEAAKAIAAKVG